MQDRGVQLSKLDLRKTVRGVRMNYLGPIQSPLWVKLRRTRCEQMSSGLSLPAQPVDATQARSAAAFAINYARQISRSSGGHALNSQQSSEEHVQGNSGP